MTRSLWCVAVSVGLVLGLASAVEAAAAPRLLPGDTVATEIRAARDSWIVGARPGRAAASVASRYGAVPLGGGAYVVKRERATALAGAFGRRGLLAYAEPDRLAHTVQAPPPDPLSSLATWRDMVVPPTLAPPRVTRRSPLLAIVDSAVDLSHPEFRGGKVSTLRAARVTFSSGTADASVAGAPANGIGILGIWPGMRVVNSPLPGSGFATCSQVTRRLRQAIGAGAAVILMVYGFTDVSGPPGAACFSQYVALQTAVRKGIVLIGPTGFRVPGTGGGERRDEPASLPHVVTVAAVDAERRPALFSVPSRAVDLAAPGVDVLAAVPPQLDRDGTVDGYRAIRGTGVAAAMVAAAAAWLLAVDPSLTPEQVAEKLRKSAQDLDVPGHDTVTGSGLLNVGSALTVDPPARDRNEPNEDILWVNGRHLRPAQRPVWSGGRPRTIRTRLNPFEDPADVYVVRVPARWSIRVKVKPRGPTDLVLAAYDVPARTVTQRRHRLGRSQSLGAGTESLLLRNATPRARTLYLHTYINRGETTGQGNVPYSLTIAGSPTGR